MVQIPNFLRKKKIPREVRNPANFSLLVFNMPNNFINYSD